MPASSPKKKFNVPTLQDRIDAIHAELDDLVANRVDELKRQNPSIPREQLLQMLLAQAGATSCRCRAIKIVGST
jgi:hypothetical protein